MARVAAVAATAAAVVAAIGIRRWNQASLLAVRWAGTFCLLSVSGNFMRLVVQLVAVEIRERVGEGPHDTSPVFLGQSFSCCRIMELERVTLADLVGGRKKAK